MIAYTHWSNDLRTGPYIHMTAKDGYPATVAAQRNLLEDQAVRAQNDVCMDHDAIGVRHVQAAAYPGGRGDFAAANYRPDPVAEHRELADKKGNDTLARRVSLVTPDAG